MFRLSFLLAVGAVVVFAQSAFERGYTLESKAQMVKLIHDCIVESGVNVTAVTNARNGHFDDDDVAFMKYVLCIGVKGQYLNERAEFQYEKIIDDIPELTEAEMRTMLDKCSEVVGRTHEESAFLKYKCGVANSPRPMFILSGPLV